MSKLNVQEALLSIHAGSLTPDGSGSMARLAETYRSGLRVLGIGALYIAPLVLRVALALPFFRSGLTRWDGWFSLAPSTTFLFSELFKLHILGAEYAIPFPDLVSYLVGIGEITLPILLVLGLGTRLAALGILAMTAVIQLVVPDGWVNFHLYWAAIALAIVALGGGAISVDRLIDKLIPQVNRAGHKST